MLAALAFRAHVFDSLLFRGGGLIFWGALILTCLRLFLSELMCLPLFCSGGGLIFIII